MTKADILSSADSPPEHLTPAEAEALMHLALGYSGKQAARLRGVSYKTIRAQRESAYRKIGARNGPHAVALYLAMGGADAYQGTPRLS